MKINHEETKETKKDQKKNLRDLRFFVVDFRRSHSCRYETPRNNENRPWVRIASSVLCFDQWPIEEASHAGSDAYPGIFRGETIMSLNIVELRQAEGLITLFGRPIKIWPFDWWPFN